MRHAHVRGSPARATVFLGGGRITCALIAGLHLAGYKHPIVVHDRHVGKLRQLKRQHDVAVEPDLRRAVDQAHLLIIAVRPDGVSGLLSAIGTIQRPITAISLAAGVPLTKLRARLGPPVRWARAMPSPVCRTGRGLTAVTFEPSLPRAGRHEVKQLFEKVGQVIEIPESRFDAFTVTYSASHGYHALAALAGAAEKLGLDRRTAITAAAHALSDGVITWREGKVSLKQLLREAATPGGTAASVMAALTSAGYERAIEKGIRAGIARARKNARLG
ncbi:MAG TPA: pyrroline-5-carboxylate reductase dimerization domain-containing protein [Candidatus Limnocylindrales bacterium]|nr:pyrroline-5-carboxylate reductase dimerization domain-containing protein [Candidatus Limnocylindrales bacterium]